MDDQCAKDLLRLAKLRGLPVAGLAAALEDGVLSFGSHRESKAWFIRDERAGCARRLDGKPWQTRSGPAKALDTRGTNGSLIGHPIGIQKATDYECIVVTEGAPDLLAAYAVRKALQARFGIVCLLGAALTIHEAALRCFVGKRARIVTHNDECGRSFADRNARLLARGGAEVSVADLGGLRDAAGNEASDLCDALGFRRPWQIPEEIAELFDFTRTASRIRCVPKHGELFAPFSDVTKDNGITDGGPTKTNEGKKEEREEELQQLCLKARALACTGRGQTRKRLFNVAREVRGLEVRRDGVDKDARLAAFDAWHAASVAHLDHSEAREEYLGRFQAMLRKVRSPADGKQTLARAIKRARARPLPDLRGAPGASDGLRLLAAVCGELQRLAGDAPFLLATRDAAEIATGERHAEKGSRALDALDALDVITCVKRGDPRPGGEASRWRCLLPTPPSSESEQ